MRWSERQRQMLQEIGIRLWLADADPPAAGFDGAASSAPTPSPVSDDGVVVVERLDIGLLDWPELAERAAACTACALCGGRTRSVLGAGNGQADWMIVGDAPDEDDDRAGEPFAGKAGQLLANMLNAIGLTRAEAAPSRQVYVAPVVKCRPPGARTPEPGEVACCGPFLRRQVQLVQPRIILAMGRVAAQGLLQSTEALGKLRGRVHRYHGVPLIVTGSPAYLLRHPEAKADAWDDLCLAVETARN